MKKQWMSRLLALMLALMLSVPFIALAEEPVIEVEMVDEPINDDEELAQELPLDEAVDVTYAEPVAEAAEAPTEELVEEITEESTEELTEVPVEEIAEEPVALIEEVSVAQPAEVAPTAEEIVMVEEDAAAKVASVAIDRSQGNVFYVGMGPVQLSAAIQPAGAQAKLKWKSSKKKVAKINANGVLTPRKAGKTKITVKAGKKKSSFKVTIRKNLVDNINPRPTVASLAATGRDWDIFLKSVERKLNGSYVCKVYLMNNLGKSKKITNLGVRLYVGETVVAEKIFPRIKIACKKGKSKVFKITFDPASLVTPGALLLPSYGNNLRLEVINTPNLIYNVPKQKKTVQPTSVVEGTPALVTGGSGYVLNTSTKKFHYPSCNDVPRISPENYETTGASRDEIIASGYSPCGHCYP